MDFSSLFGPRRSVRCVPGGTKGALDEDLELAADVVIVDLQDSVVPSNVKPAGAQAIAAIWSGGFGSREIILLVNPIETPLVPARLAKSPSAVLIPIIPCRASSPAAIIW